MTRQEFINKIAPIVQEYAPEYNICCPSAVIAQAVLESDGGNSELAVNAHNYFGLKYRTNRCPTACGIYYKSGSEQNADGTYTSSAMQWMKFNNMEDGVRGYFDFINISNYSNLKGVTNPKTYLENIKKDGYATSINYVANVYKVVETYNLTKYDTISGVENNMSNPVIALSAGHGLYTAGKRCLKSIDPNETREWVLNDRIVDKIEQKLKAYYCTVVRVNDTTGKVDTPLSTRVATANNKNADIYLSMHHNAAINGGSGGGTIVYYYPIDNRKAIATKLYNHIVACTGLKGNRSTPVASTTELYEPKTPKAISFLIENGFMDSTTDVPIILSEEHAEKTAVGVVNFLVEYFNLKKNGNVVVTKPTTTTILNKNFPSTPFYVQVLVSDLNYRSDASMSGRVLGQTGKGKFTIVEVKDGWGLLKSSEEYRNRWIYLENPSYCKIGSTIASVNKFIPYKVKVTDNSLNIRKGAGTNYGIIGVIKDNGIYTIVDETNGIGATKWGLLKSGEDKRNKWISLDFVKKI